MAIIFSVVIAAAVVGTFAGVELTDPNSKTNRTGKNSLRRTLNTSRNYYVSHVDQGFNPVSIY